MSQEPSQPGPAHPGQRILGNRVVKLQVAPEKSGRARHDLAEVLRLPGRRDSLAADPGRGQQPDPDLGAGQTAVSRARADWGASSCATRSAANSFSSGQTGRSPSFSRVVLFRKAPADGTFTVTLGLAGYAEAYFDDFRVEVIEETRATTEPNLVQDRRAKLRHRPAFPIRGCRPPPSRPTDSRPR